MKWNKKFKMGDDKIEHGLAGAAGVGVLWALGLPLGICIALALLVMFLFEPFQGITGTGVPDIWDFVCGAIGCVVFGILLHLANLYTKASKKKGVE
jgi:hypothetical protein